MRTFKTPKGTELSLVNLQGKDYLPVQERIRWFREENPESTILSRIEKLEEKYVITQATVYQKNGVIWAVAHKHEEFTRGRDNAIEKSETGAIGRALALCGYGTQFATEEFEEGERIADAPVERRSTLVGSSPPAKAAVSPSPSLKPKSRITTDRLGHLVALTKKKEVPLKIVSEFIKKLADKAKADELTVDEGEKVIEFVEAWHKAPALSPMDFNLSPQ